MKKIYLRRKGQWREEGVAPDYRFSLANERTYLAWIRTSLALLAGAIALDQLTPDLANPTIRLIISCFLCLCSGFVAIYAYRRWSYNEQAMRHNKALRYTSNMKLISTILLILTITISVAISI
ncbi:YidH family protein [Vibrio astriarenae]|uniref:YidH family protein n=1 Tax=Vibrio astriarenae TaxID=1481923 RepID=UPI003B839262